MAFFTCRSIWRDRRVEVQEAFRKVLGACSTESDLVNLDTRISNPYDSFNPLSVSYIKCAPASECRPLGRQCFATQ